MKKYFPILLSKKGEVVALQHLAQSVKDNICPIIEVVDESLEKKVKEKNSEDYKIVYKDELENFLKTHWKFFGNEIIIDFSLVNEIDSKIDVIKKMLISLINSGVNIIPALQVNSSSLFGKLIKELLKTNDLKICWITSENSGGYNDFKIGVEKFIPYIGLPTSKIILLLDIGYTKHDRYYSLMDIAKNALISLKQKINEWDSVVIAAGSFPENLGELKAQSEPHRIKRNEWEIWNILKKDTALTGIKYGDFGTKNPFYTNANFAGTISVKYSTEMEFIIYKGELTQDHKDGHGQYITHASKLIKSKYYSGREFSWGDKRIFEIGNQKLTDEKTTPGSATTWVQISQNHHIALLDSLL